ncbi:MAG: plastocyanin/azurin family copper-binding protein [Dehalococcoidia bacterium]
MRLIITVIALALAGTILLSGPPAARAQESATVSVGDNVFSPAAVTIDVGGTVTWNWSGVNPHTVTASDGSFESPQQATGSFSQTFNTAGTFNYSCEVHGQVMSGTVTVNAAAGGEPTAGAGVATPTTAAAATPAVAGTPGPPVAAPSTGTGTGSDGGSGSVVLFAAALGLGAIFAAAGAFVIRRSV